MQALAEYEAGVCECGLHESEADKDPDLEIVPRHCPVCAGTARQMRVLAAEDEATVKQVYGTNKPPAAAELPDDGRHMRMRRKAPAEQG
jgi:hypothetical protein